MKYFLFILIFFITSCSPPEPGTEAWFKEKHKELKAIDPEVEITLEEFKEILLSSSSEEESDKKIMEKHSIAFWLMDDSFLPSSPKISGKCANMGGVAPKACIKLICLGVLFT